MFAALGRGAPIGTSLHAIGGFAAVALATTLVPLVTPSLVAPLSKHWAVRTCAVDIAASVHFGDHLQRQARCFVGY